MYTENLLYTVLCPCNNYRWTAAKVSQEMSRSTRGKHEGLACTPRDLFCRCIVPMSVASNWEGYHSLHYLFLQMHSFCQIAAPWRTEFLHTFLLTTSANLFRRGSWDFELQFKAPKTSPIACNTWLHSSIQEKFPTARRGSWDFELQFKAPKTRPIACKPWLHSSIQENFPTACRGS
jgi:hypothetical protein